MIFIYNCYAGTHSSSLASAVHLKKLPLDRIPTREEIFHTEYFDKLTKKDFGRMIFRGTDEDGNRVYSIGRGPSKLIIPCLVNVINVLCCEHGFREQVVFSNMSPAVNLPMQIGGFVSRRLGMTSVGAPFLAIGAQKAHQRILDIVAQTKESARRMNEHVLVLDNKI